MDKVEFIGAITAWASAHDIDMSEIMVSHGGAMLLMGLRTQTSDIDLHVSQRVWEMFAGGPSIHLGDGVYMVDVTPEISIHVGAFTDEEIKGAWVTPYRGIQSRNPQQTLEDYLSLNRDKDRVAIAILQEVAAAAELAAYVEDSTYGVRSVVLRYRSPDFGEAEGFYGTAELDRVPADIHVIRIGGNWTYVLSNGVDRCVSGIPIPKLVADAIEASNEVPLVI